MTGKVYAWGLKHTKTASKSLFLRFLLIFSWPMKQIYETKGLPSMILHCWKNFQKYYFHDELWLIMTDWRLFIVINVVSKCDFSIIQFGIMKNVQVFKGLQPTYICLKATHWNYQTNTRQILSIMSVDSVPNFLQKMTRFVRFFERLKVNKISVVFTLLYSFVHYLYMK